MWAASRRNANALFAIVVAVAVSGLLVSIAATRLWPVAAYYLMPFRLWELAVGGCCVFLSSVPSLRAVRGSGGILGVVLLAATCGGLSENTAYPGAWAMLPVLGAALLVIGGNRFVSVCLASAPLTLVGRISYSWYLWHWPMLALAHRLGRDDPAAVAVAVVGSLAVALASYLVVERTTRYRAITDARQAVVAGLLGSALVALLP